MKKKAIFFACALFVTLAIAAAEKPVYESDYVGQEKRRIKSLSDDDIQQLMQGKGWGLAKAAELNGMPGPAHVLQMKDKIHLTSEQQAKVQAEFQGMKSKAIPLGERLVTLEGELNELFADRTITDDLLKEKLNAIARVRAELRYVHLSAHLNTPKILTEQQVDQYNRLRGYSSGDPCKNIPEGHDVKMWKKHNDCDK